MSTLQDVYDRFVAQPSVDDLHSEATLSYISSGTNVAGAQGIVKSILRSRHDVQITEKVLAYHVGYSSLTVECAAQCKFKDGPSWIAPGVDDNLIDGKVCNIALIKNVVFKGGKIRSIRVYWDQATVLKQLDIVGARGRGWPITDGSTQVNLIVNTVVPEEFPPTESVEPVDVPEPTIVPAVNVISPEKPSRRTFSISDDIVPDIKEQPRLPRSGWQNNRSDFLVSDEGDVATKDRSPVRLARVGQAPRREFSFSNLAGAYNAGETPIRKGREPTHFEFSDGTDEPAPPKAKGAATSGYYHDLYEADAEEAVPHKSTARSGKGHEETHFEFDDGEGEHATVKPSKGSTSGYYHDLYAADAEEAVPRKSTARGTQGPASKHFEFDDGEGEHATVKPAKAGASYYNDLFAPENAQPKSAARSSQGAHARGLQHETIFLDNADSPPKEPVKKSIGGGTGGSRPEETIFVELAEDNNPAPQKSPPTTRRDQTHFNFGEDATPSTPVQTSRRPPAEHFSIEGTPDPREAEYRARAALQKKEVNHFRPDNVPHFSFTDISPEESAKKENTEGMNKLLKGMGRTWMMGTDSPTVSKESHRTGLPKKGLTPHFSFGGDSPTEEEKENGNGRATNTKRMHVPVVSAEKEWWE